MFDVAPEKRDQVRWNVYGAVAAVSRPVGDGADNRVRCYLDYGSYDFQIGRNGKKFYSTFNYFQLVGCTFKFRLRITHQKILMSPNFGVAIYIVGTLISRYNIGDHRLVFRC